MVDLSALVYEDPKRQPNTQPEASLVYPQNQPTDHPSEVVDLDELPDSDLQNRSSLPISVPEVVDVDESPDSDHDIGLACLARQGKQAFPIELSRLYSPLC